MILKVKNHFSVEFFNKVNVNLRYDSVASTFAFDFLFNPEDLKSKEMFTPGHFHKVTIEHNDELLITGFILNQNFGSSSKKQLANIQGYSLPGVFEDCQIPPEIYPLQSDGLSLREITQKIINYFSTSKAPMKLIVDPSVSKRANAAFETSVASESETIKSYLTKLAAQKDIVLTHTPEGNLLFTKAKTRQTPIAHFEKGFIGLTDISLSVNGQRMHSKITVLKQSSVDGGNAGESSIINPFVKFVNRPKVIIQSSGTDNDTGNAARQALSAELKAISLKIELSTWLIDGKIIKPNQIISVTDPENYLYNKTNFFIESVNLKGEQSNQTATLTCVLPEVYNELPVKNIFEP